MTALAALLTVLMAAIALLHGYWAAGGLWPGRSRAELAAIVVGRPRMTDMPPFAMSATVTVFLAGIAAWPFLIGPFVARTIAPQLAVAGNLVLAAIFLLRGLAGYTPAMASRHSAEPFARYNRILYSPLCLILGAGFLILALNGGLS
jgi:Protein of unknown function (DUF3995)